MPTFLKRLVSANAFIAAAALIGSTAAYAGYNNDVKARCIAKVDAAGLKQQPERHIEFRKCIDEGAVSAHRY
jgi:hypothetical protein